MSLPIRQNCHVSRYEWANLEHELTEFIYHHQVACQFYKDSYIGLSFYIVLILWD